MPYTAYGTFGTISQDNLTGNTQWGNPSYAEGSPDGYYATVPSVGMGVGISWGMKCVNWSTGGVPMGTTPAGGEFYLYGHQSGGSSSTFTASLVIGGVTQAASTGAVPLTIGGSDAWYGPINIDQLFLNDAVSYSDSISGDFGIEFELSWSTTSSFSIDSIRMRLAYITGAEIYSAAMSQMHDPAIEFRKAYARPIMIPYKSRVAKPFIPRRQHQPILAQL